MNRKVEVLFKREYWSGTILDKDVVWNGEKRDYVVLVTDPQIGNFLETPYYKDGELLGYLVYSSTAGIRPPTKKENVLGCFKNLLVIDPQEDCECETETYDADILPAQVIWLKNGSPEIIECANRIHLPMSKQINFEQIKQCILTALPFAQPMTDKDDPYHMILMHPEAEVDKLSDKLKDILVSFYRVDWTVICLPEIPKNKIYFSPDPEFFGCFTWNISRYGMFIIPERLRFCVI